MQQITFENWKQLGLKVGDPILIIDSVDNSEYRTTIYDICDVSGGDRRVDYEPIQFSNEYGPDDWTWIDFRDADFMYFKMNSQKETSYHTDEYHIRALFASNPTDYSEDFEGYFYHTESNTIETRNVTPYKILKHSTNQNGERVWKLRGTWITDTQIKNAINHPKQFDNQQWMIASEINGSVGMFASQTVYTNEETMKQDMQKLALTNPNNVFVAVQLTDIKVSLDLSNPVFKWD